MPSQNATETNIPTHEWYQVLVRTPDSKLLGFVIWCHRKALIVGNMGNGHRRDGYFWIRREGAGLLRKVCSFFNWMFFLFLVCMKGNQVFKLKIHRQRLCFQCAVVNVAAFSAVMHASVKGPPFHCQEADESAGWALSREVEIQVISCKLMCKSPERLVYLKENSVFLNKNAWFPRNSPDFPRNSPDFNVIELSSIYWAVLFLVSGCVGSNWYADPMVPRLPKGSAESGEVSEGVTFTGKKSRWGTPKIVLKWSVFGIGTLFCSMRFWHIFLCMYK